MTAVPQLVPRQIDDVVPVAPRAEAGPLNVCYELALKQHEQMDRSFATLDDKTKLVFGVTSFLVVGQAQVLARLDGNPWLQGALGVAWACLFAGMTFHCWRAYGLRSIKQLPNAAAIFRAMSTEPEADARKQVIAELEKAHDDNKGTYDERAKHFKRAAGFMLADVSVLVAAALASPFLRLLEL